ncbi:MAG: SLBB domain-containing protein [Steroidobacter sp.]
MLNSNHQAARLVGWQPIVLAIASMLMMPMAMAQSVKPTPQAMQIFNGLDPATQQSILQALGKSGMNPSGTATGSATQATSQNSGVSNSQRNQASDQQQAQPGPPVLQGSDTVLINIDFPHATTTVVGGNAGQPAQVLTIPAPEPDVPLTDADKLKLQQLITLIRKKNPYTLSNDGALLLPGFPPMPLAGLTIDQANARIAAEPAFAALQVSITLLPLERSGAEGLKPFGYDLFNNAPSTFAPVTDVPVPADYVVGPGDTLNVQLFGNQNNTMQLVVGRDGRINFPELGPINVSGQPFTKVQALIESRVAQQMIGVHASITMNEIRSIRVFVMGEANLPGSYTVSGLATMTTALFASGGVKPIGSLRNIQLKRQGKVVTTLDLYDLLLKGDTSNDAKLLPGDVIFIPPVGATVSVAGEVQRPAIYELKGSVSADEIIRLAGGLTSNADAGRTGVVRINGEHRDVLNVKVGTAESQQLSMRNGDVINVPRMPPTLDAAVSLKGYLYAPRLVAWHEGLRLTDVIKSVDDLKPNADIHYLLIRRELPPDRTVAVLSTDLAKALADPHGKNDLVLMPRDQITVFDFETDRSQVIRPILDELQLQSHLARPTEVVTVNGSVKVKGNYPLEPGMRVSDLLRAGGGLQSSAYGTTAELIRYTTDGGKRNTTLIPVDLAAIAKGDVAADVQLQSMDTLNVKQLPQWSDQETVMLKGEVRFPGSYPIRRGETLRELIQRAGGFTDMAFIEGSVFTRDELKDREQQQLDVLAKRLQGDLSSLALQASQAGGTQGAQASQALSIGNSLLAQLKSTKAVGRLVIDLGKVAHSPPGGEDDIVLRDGDMLIVPKIEQEVTVIGEVQNNTSLLYQNGLARDDYIQLSGGLTRKADKKLIYVVRANGAVVANTSHRWFAGGNTRIKPGDTIVVPLDTERMPALPLWQAVTQIMYNIAIAAAAVHSF